MKRKTDCMSKNNKSAEGCGMAKLAEHQVWALQCKRQCADAGLPSTGGRCRADVSLPQLAREAYTPEGRVMHRICYCSAQATRQQSVVLGLSTGSNAYQGSCIPLYP